MSVETFISEGIAEIILDCPPVNALTSSEWLDLAINIDNLAHDNDVKVIVISAKGKGFCAGADIKELQENPSKITDVNDGDDKFLKIVKNITSKGFVRSNYEEKLVDLSDVRINLKTKS